MSNEITAYLSGFIVCGAVCMAAAAPYPCNIIAIGVGNGSIFWALYLLSGDHINDNDY